MIAGGNRWRANEIVTRHLTRQTATRYRCDARAGIGQAIAIGLAEVGGRSFVRSRRQLGTRGHRRGDRRQLSTLSEADRRRFRRGGGRLRLDERCRGADEPLSLAVSGAVMTNARRTCTDANTYGARALLTGR
jgi:hypothetical protein